MLLIATFMFEPGEAGDELGRGKGKQHCPAREAGFGQ